MSNISNDIYYDSSFTYYEKLKKDFLTKQIITYMGNKRKIIPYIEKIIIDIQNKLYENTEKKYNNEERNYLICGDGFSGSGIVSRLLKMYSKKLYVNDLAGYSKTINSCFLSNISNENEIKIKKIIDNANYFVDKGGKDINFEKYRFISKYWSPNNDKNIKKGERAYFTKENGERIDKYIYYINNISCFYNGVDINIDIDIDIDICCNNGIINNIDKIKIILLSQLIIKCSIHNNTSGHFAAFYKKDGIGHFGGKNDNDLNRITRLIRLDYPIFYNNNCYVNIQNKDTNEWIVDLKKREKKLDIVYYDPPYNKHPYNIYYFLLDIINNLDINIEIPDSLRGQPKNWKKSLYNSINKAEKVFEELILNTNSKYIIISYNNDGIILPEKMEEILNKKGDVELIELEHKTYNRLKGIADYKRKNGNKKIKEFLWVVKTS